MNLKTYCLIPALLAAVALASATAADPEPTPPPLTRLFIQDAKATTLRWADLRLSESGGFSLGPLTPVKGFPALDPARQKLVQMKEAGGLVMLGVRDDDGGAFQSGYVLVRTGVNHDDHGDHAHWGYAKKPTVPESRLDSAQGNPAHLYVYGGRFYLANDKLGGATRLDPADYRKGAERIAPRFVSGGGGHITLAVVDDKVGYATWIDGGGPNKGRVDVTPIAAPDKPAYSFRLASGAIHGATANSGKVFFAPADGVDWVEADPEHKLKGDEVKVRHIDLGTEGDKPRRTGAFADHGRFVGVVTGKDAPALVLLDAAAPEPKPLTVPLPPAPGTAAVTPVLTAGPGGRAFAFVFRDRSKGSDAPDRLDIIELDPNRDGDCADAKFVKSLAVGKSAAEGHAGHHEMSFDADRRYAVFANPGDGSISVLSLTNLDVVATLNVGGTPGAIVAVGGADGGD